MKVFLYSLSLLILLLLPTNISAAERPNILWIFVEDLSPWIGCYGDEINKEATPNIDALAARGVRFDRCYMPAPVCSACRSAVITGVMQTTTGTHNHRSSRTPDSAIHLPKGMKTIPEIFQEHGYATFNRGKDDYNFVYKRADLYTVGTRKGKKKKKGSFYGKGGNQDAWDQVPKGKPFFGQIMLWGGKDRTQKLKNKVDPHSVTVPPYFPNTEIFQKEWAHHYDTIRVTDKKTGGILKQLKEAGLLENTIIFFFSDHGNNHSLRHKQFCYEGGVQVPLIIAGPVGASNLKIKTGTVRRDLVSGIDISATTLALAGIPLPSYLEGHDLFADDFSPRTYVISARDRCDYSIDRIRTVRTDKFRYLKNFLTDRPLLQPQYRDGQPATKMLRKLHAEGKLNSIQEAAFFGPRPSEELYDIEKDPHQINNLAKDPAFAGELKHHRTILEKWIKATDDKGQYPEPDNSLRAVLKRWGKKCVNPEYDHLRKEAEADKKKAATNARGGAGTHKIAADKYSIQSPPKELKADTFYTKYIDANGYPIIASAKVNDYALKEAAYLVNMMLAKRPDIKRAMTLSGSHLSIMAYNEFTSDMPEYKWLKPHDFWDARARGLGGSKTDPFCSCAEENLLAYPGDPYSQECILIHEFAHNIHLRGMVNIDKTFDDRLKKAYKKAMAAGLWKGVYASTDYREYFAEGVQSWFDNNRENDNEHNHVNTRKELKEYDPALAKLCKEVFGDTKLAYTKPATRLHEHMQGYNPKKAPTFTWPKRLDKVRAKQKFDAEVRSKKDKQR